MSIFGIKKKHVDTLGLKREIFDMRNLAFTQLNTLSDRHKNLQDKVRDMTVKTNLIDGKVNQFKKVISICAESKGPLQNNEVFSFGNGGRENECGCVMNFRGDILGIGLSSKRIKGDVRVIIAINGIEQRGYEINLNNLVRKHDNFDIPLRFNAGDAIDFICKTDNSSCLNTVVSMVIELFI